jgi:hypothetical protein
MTRLLKFSRTIRSLLPILLATMCLSMVQVAEACPLCKQALENSETAGADPVRGYFWSILFMMSMPFLLLGSFSGYMYLAVRKARREQEAKAAEQRDLPATQAVERELVEV